MNKVNQATGKELKELADFWAAVICPICDKNMGARWTVHGKRIYCSDACRQAAYRIRRYQS